MTVLELIGVAIGSAAAIIAAINEWRKYNRTKKVTDIEKNNSKALDNGVSIMKIVRYLTKQYNGNRVSLFSLHNSGNILTGTCQKKISILPYEDTSSITVKELYDLWQNRPVDSEMLRLMDHLNKDEYIHYEDVTSIIEDHVGIRAMLNAAQGKEVYFVKVGWYEKDKLICLFIQRDITVNTTKLNIRHKAEINYKVGEIKELLDQINFK